MKILLCGVPFGCDNIGDEAILQCVCETFRRLFPQAELTVSTNDRENTAKLLNINTIPLYKFKPCNDGKTLPEVLSQFDLLVWSGATGLSDYPETALAYLDAAHSVNLPCIIWNTGMNNTLNPAFYRMRDGNKRKILTLAGKLIGKDLVKIREKHKENATRRHIAETLKKCALVVVRDPQSKVELERCGFQQAVVGADPALRLPSQPLSPLVAEQVRVRPAKRIGVCISSQSPLQNESDFAGLLNRLLENADTQVLFIPMNPITDYNLMKKLQNRLTHPERSILVANCVLPGEVQQLAASCNIILSSRLHLLILAGNVNVVPQGLERGSKVSNFLSNFGFSSVGDVAEWDAEAVYKVLTADYPDFPEHCRKIHDELLKRLDSAEQKLLECVNKL